MKSPLNDIAAKLQKELSEALPKFSFNVEWHDGLIASDWQDTAELEGWLRDKGIDATISPTFEGFIVHWQLKVNDKILAGKTCISRNMVEDAILRHQNIIFSKIERAVEAALGFHHCYR